MTYNEAFGAILYGLIISAFLAWYLWCLRTMFSRCVRPREFFSHAYSTSGAFLMVNVLAAICAAAGLLVWLTN